MLRQTDLQRISEGDTECLRLGERDAAGTISNPRMAIRKVRGGPTGGEIRFTPRVAQIGEDGAETTMAIGRRMHSTGFCVPCPSPRSSREGMVHSVDCERSPDQPPRAFRRTAYQQGSCCQW